MIIDLTHKNPLKDDLREYFSDPVNIVRALVLAKSVLPEWYYEEIKKELISLHPTPDYLASMLYSPSCGADAVGPHIHANGRITPF